MQNNSGVIPLDLRVVVMPDPAETKTAGGIIIPEATAEREKAAAVKGTLVAFGEHAFGDAFSVHRNANERVRKAEARYDEAFAELEAAQASLADAQQPYEAGARVMIGKYAGVVFKGTDGNEYRIMNDEDIVGLLTE